MAAFDVRDMLKADSAAQAAPGMSGSSITQMGRALHPLAERIAALPVKPSLSPIMIEGCVRVLDALSVIAAGSLIYWLYASGRVEEALPYQITIPTLALGAIGVFQALQLYNVGALRHYLRSAVKLLTGWTMLFLAAL